MRAAHQAALAHSVRVIPAFAALGTGGSGCIEREYLAGGTAGTESLSPGLRLLDRRLVQLDARLRHGGRRLRTDELPVSLRPVLQRTEKSLVVGLYGETVGELVHSG